MLHSVLRYLLFVGQPGRYTLVEKFKDFQRCMTPSEHILETLERYGELARDVQLTLILNGPVGSDPASRRYQQCPPVRRKDAGSGRLRRGSSSQSLHRQSLPPLIEQQTEDIKRPKRKSLTIMEEAWEWLENLGRGKVYKTRSEKDLCKKNEKKNRISSQETLYFCKGSTSPNSTVKVNSDTLLGSDLDHQTSCCIRSHHKARECQSSEENIQELTSLVIANEKKRLIENILNQKCSLEDLKMQIAHVDGEILRLEEQHIINKAEEEAKQKESEEELEQIMFWENELTAEKGHERDLQSQFLDIKDRVMETKAKLEDLKEKTQGLDFGDTVTHYSQILCTNDQNKAGDLRGRITPNRKSQPREDCSPPHALVAPCQIKDRRTIGAAELRELWARWAQTQNVHKENKIIHRTELTIYLKSTKV